MNKQDIRRRYKPVPLSDKLLSVGYPSDESSNPSERPRMDMIDRMKKEKEERERNTVRMTKDESAERDGMRENEE